jgi:hypothetical protein
MLRLNEVGMILANWRSTIVTSVVVICKVLGNALLGPTPYKAEKWLKLLQPLAWWTDNIRNALEANSSAGTTALGVYGGPKAGPRWTGGDAGNAAKQGEAAAARAFQTAYRHCCDDEQCHAKGDGDKV